MEEFISIQMIKWYVLAFQLCNVFLFLFFLNFSKKTLIGPDKGRPW